MDLVTAVVVSMLGTSRLRAAAAFNTLRLSGTDPSVDDVLAHLRVPLEEAARLRIDAKALAEQALEKGESLGFVPIPLGDARYPPLLACTDDPPPVLWTHGRVDLLSKLAVAIVGSRAASPYALQVARRLAAELAGRGIVVVSGLARGADSAAHHGCLEAGGETVAVLGSGLDRIYPSEHRQLAADIASKGLVVSELGPGGAPLAEHFPLRNRIISGISLGTVVVEASESSGSLITAACALRQGRDVMAVPGSVLSGRNRGSHQLLKDGAKVVETADDILEELGWTQPSAAAPRVGGRRATDPVLSRMDAGEGYRLDDLVAATGMAAPKLLPRLLELELRGEIETGPGGVFIRCDRER